MLLYYFDIYSPGALTRWRHKWSTFAELKHADEKDFSYEFIHFIENVFLQIKKLKHCTAGLLIPPHYFFFLQAWLLVSFLQKEHPFHFDTSLSDSNSYFPAKRKYNIEINIQM